MENVELVILSFFCSFGLGIVFRVDKKNLLPAGLGGAITRFVYLIMLEITDLTFVQFLVSAMIASIYAELMAMERKMPSTVFLYPSIIPLIPGSTLYYVAVNLILGDSAAMGYISEMVLSLAGICLGFVLTSTFTYYRRLYYLGEHIESGLKKMLRSLFGKRT